MFIIYKHTSTNTNKSYIGLTKNGIKLRWQQHVSKAVTNVTNNHFHNAIRKYGRCNWKHIVLEKHIPTLVLARKKEQEYINSYDTFNNGYNDTIGGEGVSGVSGVDHHFYGKSQTKEHIEKALISRTKTKNSWSTLRKNEFSKALTEALRRRHNSKQYSFYHNEHGVVTAYPDQLAKQFGLHQGYVNYVAQGKSRHAGGWFLYIGINADYSLYPIYTFIHSTFGIEILTLKEMATKYSLSKGNLCMVAKGQRNHTKGWKIVNTEKTQLDIKAADSLLSAEREVNSTTPK